MRLSQRLACTWISHDDYDDPDNADYNDPAHDSGLEDDREFDDE